MPNRIIPKKSSVAAKVPLATDLSVGEIAINLADKKIYSKDSGGTVIELANGTVTSVAMSVPTGLTVSGTPITSSGTLAVTLTSGYSIPTTASQTNWDTAYADRNKWDGGSTGLVAATGRTSLGGTTVGQNLFTLTNPSAITFPRINADNTVSALDAATFRTAIGAGTSSTTGTVTSVGGTGTVSGLTLTGTVTTTGNLTLGGTLAVTPSNFASQTANTVLAAPNGLAGAPTFRTLATADLPTTLQSNSYAPGITGSTSAAVTAAGTTQGTATALTSDVNIVTTSTAGTGLGVVMMGATSGKYAVIVNRSANAINLYPASGHSFDGLAVNTPISIPVNGFIEMFGSSTTQWHTTYQAVTQGSFVVGAVASATNADTLDGQHAAAFALVGQTTYIGTTAVAINRASASLSLTGVSIDGSAGSVAWSGVSSKPTTLSGYGITDALALSGGSLTGGLKEAKVAMAANDVNISSGNYFTKTISGATTLTVSNVPTTGTVAAFVLDLTNGGSATITWWTGMKWAAGTAPTLTTSGRDVLAFFTHDGGTTWSGFVLGKDVK